MSIPKKISALVVFVVLASCSRTTDKVVSENGPALEFTVEAAPEWTALFKRSSGWFGGDGIFAMPLDGKDQTAAGDSILFVFSDTMVGEIKGDSLQPGYTMINNSVMILEGAGPSPDKAHFLLNQNKEGKPASLFVPATPKTGKEDYYWLGDGFVNPADHTLYIFAYRIRNTNDGSNFPFQEMGGVLLSIPKNSPYPFTGYKQYDLPFPSQQEDSLSTSFGAGVLVNTAEAGAPSPDGYIYVYGVRGKAKELVVARAKAETFTDFSTWQFRAGNDWSGELKKASALADSVSNELSVTPVGNNQYALVYQYGGLLPDIMLQAGSSPAGPFGPRQKVWNTSDDVREGKLFSYNAKAHPALSKPGELLVSYNVNSFDFAHEIERQPNLYRPRFVRIIFKK